MTSEGPIELCLVDYYVDTRLYKPVLYYSAKVIVVYITYPITTSVKKYSFAHGNNYNLLEMIGTIVIIKVHSKETR